ncbi:MAG: hypothetical protein KAT65_27980, partial [Methanophagales archaeon]|nr:hypothetical protein [Methanophagales archaeon]
MRKKTKIMVIIVAVFALCLLLVNNIAADSITVTGPDEPMGKTFNTPKDTTPYFTASTSFWITNNENETIEYSVTDITHGNEITITPDHSLGSIDRYGSVQISLT